MLAAGRKKRRVGWEVEEGKSHEGLFEGKGGGGGVWRLAGPCDSS